ncbi:unnamed protein product [Linum trigynum]|uniref:Alpha/beta hydrolase fold-3 domain-containing protein n=1 Tax=Linum trigynum TaxID=586398 RepID=A0AAV2FZE1_9ROSI
MPESETPGAVDFEDCLGVLRVYKDGTVWRSSDASLFSTQVNDDGSVVWKDTIFDPQNDLHLRLYKPSSSSSAAAAAAAKLPVVYNIHGGGFCLGSRTSPNCHNCCLRLSSTLQAVVVSPDYRLAPEHRLPAAVDDGHAALKWLRDRAVAGDDTWLSDVADFGKVLVCGESAGGNIAHNLAVRLGSGSPELDPVVVKGYVLMAPFFGGTVRTKSEVEATKDQILNLDLVDWFFRHSVPIGDTSDHPLVNPFGPRSESLEALELDPMVVVCGGDDILVDRVRDYVEKLKKLGKRVEYAELEGEGHGFFVNNLDSEAVKSVMEMMKKLVNG